MKTLIVYYSLEGNTDYAARLIAEELGADTLRLVPKKAYHDKGLRKFLWGGRSALMAEKPALEPYEADLSACGRVIFGFPVWASNYTPPLRTFIEENAAGLAGKRLAAFACQKGAGAERALKKLAESLHVSALEAQAVFIDPKQQRSDKTDAAIRAFAAQFRD